MDVDDCDSVESSLHAYVAAIAEYFGVPPDQTSCEAGKLATAYIGFSRRAPDFPHRDLALVWDERLGWAAAVQTPSGELIVFSYLGTSPVPHVNVVTSFVNELIAGRDHGQNSPPFFGRCDDLPGKLTAATRGTARRTATRVTSPTR